MLKLLLKILYASPKYFLTAFVFCSEKKKFLICIIKFFFKYGKSEVPCVVDLGVLPSFSFRNKTLITSTARTATEKQPTAVRSLGVLPPARSKPFPRDLWLKKPGSQRVFHPQNFLWNNKGGPSRLDSSSTPPDSGFPPSLPSLWGDGTDLYIDCGVDPNSTA